MVKKITTLEKFFKFRSKYFMSFPLMLCSQEFLKNFSSEEIKEITFYLYKTYNSNHSKKFDNNTDNEKLKEIYNYIENNVNNKVKKQSDILFVIMKDNLKQIKNRQKGKNNSLAL